MKVATLWSCALLSGLLLNSTRSIAQDIPIHLGSFSAKELPSAPADTTAPAEVLCDFGQSKIEGGMDGFVVRFDRITRVHILRRTGYEWATVKVPLYHRDGQQEKLQQLKGFTYNLVGGEWKKEPLKTDAVFSRKLTANVDEYAFTLPNVREGSVIEFSYAILSNFVFNLQDWQFQQEIPVRWSEYRTTVPSFFRYKEISRSYLPFAVNETTTPFYRTSYRSKTSDGHGGYSAGASDKVYNISTQAVARRWVLKDAPAFREEPFLTTPRDYLSRVDFELERIQFPDQEPQFVVGTWEQIEKNLLKDEEFGGFLERATPLTSGAAALATLHANDLPARADAVRTLVMQAVGYDGTNTLYAEHSAKKLLELRHGTAGEVNLLLVRTLRDAGLTANPLLLSTRAHGRIQTDLPVVSQFNYVVAHVTLPDGKELLLDATEPLLPFTLLPERCLNNQGRLLSTTGRWVPLTTTQTHLVYTAADFTLDARSTISGTIRQEYAGYAAPSARSTARESEHALRKQWQSTHPDWTVERADVAGTNELGKPLVVTFTTRLAGAEEAVATMYVRPLQHLGPGASPFRHDERLFPVDLPSSRRLEYSVKLHLPTGYSATSLPTSALINLPNDGGRFLYSVSQLSPETLQITARLALNKTQYSPNEYVALRELYARALAKMAEPLVLTKQTK
ncbi:hypothetical protein [Hymenobacter mucosus]|uniref:DUF3857 domain-containing protein n=1 Tax=Hymenobacter mucosus TaxID=1411120 RepID=A0A238YFH6_9BACT|nr:hypothetical protein [Hymenobacter mucosus]SNR69354.1 hypothetical protein SAMN06269173_105170 [Hymenobacter mucosus]